MDFGSLFAGIGGIDLGLERAGMRCAWQVEIDPFCQKVLAKHWPNVERFNDVRECGKQNLTPVDLIAGGFPCQDISNAGQRAGIRGKRSGLWAEFHRIICELQPRYVLVENVAALLVRGMGVVLGDLAQGGYDAEWASIQAAHFGAPHLRERIFLLAYPAPNGSKHDGKDSLSGLIEWGQITRLGLGGSCVGCGAHTSQAMAWNDSTWRDNGGEQAKPVMVGMADGIPNRVDRLGSLGNAVVPQVAEWIGRRIVQVAEEQR